jgi:hypothetical protein
MSRSQSTSPARMRGTIHCGRKRTPRRCAMARAISIWNPGASSFSLAYGSAFGFAHTVISPSVRISSHPFAMESDANRASANVQAARITRV